MRTIIGIVACFCLSACSASVYLVRNTNDSGTDSLRWAITKANVNAGEDAIIFREALGGHTIELQSRLPMITDDHTIIDASIGFVIGQPNVGVSGANLVDDVQDDGLRVSADYCTIRNLALTDFPAAGIHLLGANHCAVMGCNLGTDLDGLAAAPNRVGVYLENSSNNRVGSGYSSERNVILGHPEDFSFTDGIVIFAGSNNEVYGNYIGLNRVGAATSRGWRGVVVTGSPEVTSDLNHIGGTDAGTHNYIASFDWGIAVFGHVTRTRITRNRIGLTTGGSLVPMANNCIGVSHSAASTVIGGTTEADRNVFAGGAQNGVLINNNPGTGTLVRANYFGTNAPGTARRDLRTGVRIEAGEGVRVTIGGPTAASGNTFAPWHAAGGVGVRVTGQCAVTIRNNEFGRLPNGANATAMLDAVYVNDSSPTITDNAVANALLAGVQVVGAASNPRVYRNTFDNCDRAVWIMEGQCRLGNLWNDATDDDGGNIFAATNDWFICNSTTNRLRAEGNDFDTTQRADIDAKIHDQLDVASRGLVDYDPLVGGVHPSVVGAGARLSGLAAAPTAAGAQVTFTLSAPAEVSVVVLNLAGRTVRRLASGLRSQGGLTTLVWDGRGDTGARAPAGAYLVRVQAHAADGATSQAGAALQLRR